MFSFFCRFFLAKSISKLYYLPTNSRLSLASQQLLYLFFLIIRKVLCLMSSKTFLSFILSLSLSCKMIFNKRNCEKMNYKLLVFYFASIWFSGKHHLRVESFVFDMLKICQKKRNHSSNYFTLCTKFPCAFAL